MSRVRHAEHHWGDAAVMHRSNCSSDSAMHRAGDDHFIDEDDTGSVSDDRRHSTPVEKPLRSSSFNHVDASHFSSLRQRGEAALSTRRPPVSTPLMAATFVSSTTARSHSPAVWVCEEEKHGRLEGGFGGDTNRSASLLSGPRHPQQTDSHQRGTLEVSGLDNVGAVQASSPRVVDNRLCFFPLPAETGEGDKCSRPGPICRVARAESSASSDAYCSESRTSSKNDDGRNSDAVAGLRSLAIKAKGKPASQPSSGQLHDAAHSFSSETHSRFKEKSKRVPTAHSMKVSSKRSPLSRTVRRVPSGCPSSSSSSSSSSLARSVSTPLSSSPSPPRHSVKMKHKSNAGRVLSPPDTTVYMDEMYLAGLGPLMVVRLDVLPEPAVTRLAPSQEGVARHEGVLGDVASSSPSLPQVHPVHMDPYWGALVPQQETDAHEREVEALHARLESLTQRLRITEQQVTATAEARAADLVSGYKADERKRREQFQSALAALREENQDLTARLETAARGPAMGVSSAATYPTPTTSHDVVAGAIEKAVAATSTPLVAGTTGVHEAEVTQRLQSIETYWRDRLRTAERHWEEEAMRQTQQRREALDQVEELVHTVEQLQEELRCTRRQASQLREENTRLCRATVNLSAPSTEAPSPNEVSLLRQTLREYQHKEAALMAQVESYSEEATRVRLRCGAALEKAEQQLAAEQRRSTEMVKLYGSQLQSLHQQLREAKSRLAVEL